MQIASSTPSFHCSLSPLAESISVVIPWEYCFILIQYILQYYVFFFPYRTRPLAIKSRLNINELIEKPFILHQSTSTSSICTIPTKASRSVSTQTSSLQPLNLQNIHPNNNNNNNEIYTNDQGKQRIFSFNRGMLPSASLFTNFFRRSATTLLPSRDFSTKSSASLGQRSSAASSLCPTRQQYLYRYQSSKVYRQIESEMDNVLSDEHRPRASSSSSGLIRTSHRQGNHTSSYWHRPLRRRQQYQTRSAYFIKNPNVNNFRQHQPLTSTTNTNSSDSSSVFHRFNPRFFPTMSQQQQHQQQQSQSQRIRDEHIVAANERKALKVLMIIFCVFVTLWTPFFICTFISAVCDQCRISSTVWFSITWLGYSSSMANPFIYTIFSDAFRRAFTNILFCRSSDSSISRQFSVKSSYQKGTAAHQQLLYRRSPNHEYSGTSSPITLHHPTLIGGSDATIYVNRCASDTFR
jgi:hypothetical protein